MSILFDSIDYARCLPHIGQPLPIAGLSFPPIIRVIPGNLQKDAMAAWPYVTPPTWEAFASALEQMRTEGVVTFTAVLRPDACVSELKTLAGVTLVPLKQHFIFAPELPPPQFSAKTRRNLAIAEKHWHIAELSPDAATAALCLESHKRLALRRKLNAITAMPDEHFRMLFALPGIRILAARNNDELGAVLIAAKNEGETHMLHFCVEEHAFKTCAAHLLMQAAVTLWGKEGTVYLGGYPSGPDGEGIARFKKRWVNRTCQVFMLTAVVDEKLYKELSAGFIADNYFPAYRAPRLTRGEP
jgi:hypothetical protein